MSKASREIVRNPERSLLDIGVEYGYGSHEAFTRAFYSVWQISPSEFRKNPSAFELFPGYRIDRELMEEKTMADRKKVDISELYDCIRDRKGCYLVLGDIKALMQKGGFDIAFVVDPDVDRLALFCEDGTMYGEEYTLVTVADYILQHTPGNTVSNLSSTRALRDVTRKYGCEYNAAAVGEVNVVTKMKATNAVIGGEGNGGVIYPAAHYGRDALVGIALILTYLAKKGMTTSELRATYPPYCIAKNRIDLTPDTDVDAILAKVKELYKNEEVNAIDGVKIDFPDKWVHLRKSNTEPIIRVYSEAATMEAADQLGKQIMDVVYSMTK